jgi:hypothetical protein
MLYIDFELDELVTEERLKVSYEANKAEYETFDYYVSGCLYMNNGSLAYIKNESEIKDRNKFWVLWHGGNSAKAYSDFGEFANDMIFYHGKYGSDFWGYRVNGTEIDRYYNVMY